MGGVGVGGGGVVVLRFQRVVGVCGVDVIEGRLRPGLTARPTMNVTRRNHLYHDRSTFPKRGFRHSTLEGARRSLQRSFSHVWGVGGGGAKGGGNPGTAMVSLFCV